MSRGASRFVLFGVIAGVGCWYGPPEWSARIEHALRRPDSHTVAIAVTRRLERPPLGLATFPNGGVRRALEATIDLYFGDVGGGWIRHSARRPVPPRILHGLAVHFDGWEGESAYLTVSGCAQDECWGDLRHSERFRIWPDGSLEAVDSIPRTARSAGESLARMAGERTFLRVGYDRGAVEAALEPGLDREVVFRLHPGDGRLRVADPYPFATDGRKRGSNP